MKKLLLAPVLALGLVACESLPSDEPEYTQAISCNAVAPLHQRLEAEVRAGKLDDQLTLIQALNNRYRAICVDGEPLPGQAAALLDEIALVLSQVDA